MKGFKVYGFLYYTVLLIAGCAVPLGEDYTLNRDGVAPDSIYIENYNLLNYVPIPAMGKAPVVFDNRTDLDLTVLWKNDADMILPSFTAFLPNTVYQAEIRLTAKEGYAFYDIPFTYPNGKIDTQIDDLGNPVRTVRVRYNNSDDADVTFITDYNLQNYIPVPMSEEQAIRNVNRADMTIDVVWREQTSPGVFGNPLIGDFTFDLGVVYRAEIRLAANTDADYHFSETKTFAYPNVTVTSTDGSETHRDLRFLTATYEATRKPLSINDLNLTPYILKPTSGVTPVWSFAGPQYTGTINWKNTETGAVPIGPFQSDTAYTAELILTPISGYTCKDLGENVFIHTGVGRPEDITNPAGSGSATIHFAVTANKGLTPVYDTILTTRIPKPIGGITPVSNIAGSQYTGTVTWTPPDNLFKAGVAYKADVTLYAAPGYTFTGITQNVFSHGDAGTISNPADSGLVTINFSPASSSIFTANTFGPVTSEGSALKLMEERRGDNYTLTIDLVSGPEDVIPNSAVLMAGGTSPANVSINGHGRILTIPGSGTLLTVSGGVTLTLVNITLKGIEGNETNNAPLVKVQSGGTLVLGEGVEITNNTSTGNVGGIWVNGGSVVLNSGAKIKKMKARQGGGVLIDAGGRFSINGGIIGGVDSSDGNTATAENSGGGVFINNGSFDIYTGAIQSNCAEAVKSGGGVFIQKGTFRQYGGTIKGNTALASESGGGVYVGSGGVFSMYGVDAYIEENSAEAGDSGGGMYDVSDGGEPIGEGYEDSVMIFAGSIRRNTAKGIRSGGGVRSESSCFYMDGGIIEDNVAMAANSGGGLYGSVELVTGYIKNNRAKGEYSGGGLYSTSTSINGAMVIENNIAEQAFSGGGVYNALGMYMHGTAIIRNNEAWGANSGGGVSLCSEYGGDRTRIGYATIQNNITKGLNSGGGIYIHNPSQPPKSIELESGIIKGNRAQGAHSAGAIYINRGTLKITNRSSIYDESIIGGTLPGDANIADNGVNGVYISANGSFSMKESVIQGNTGGNNNYGVYVDNNAVEAFVMMDSFFLAPKVSGLVFLTDGATITFQESSSHSNDNMADIICNSSPEEGVTKLLSFTNYDYQPAKTLSDYYNRFLYNGEPLSEPDLSGPEGGAYYGIYKGVELP